MTVFTTETLIMTLLTLAEELDIYFSITRAAKGKYVVWAGPEYIIEDNLEKGLTWAYRILAGIAKEKGLQIVDEEADLA